jgi:hypothetical protein
MTTDTTQSMSSNISHGSAEASRLIASSIAASGGAADTGTTRRATIESDAPQSKRFRSI